MALDHCSETTATEEEEAQQPKQEQGPQVWSSDDVYSTILASLTNSIDPKETASALTKPINAFVESNGPRTDESPDETDIWDTMLLIARQQPPSSPFITSLVTLLAAVKEMPSPDHWPHPWYLGQQQSWRDLLGFGPEVRENWNRDIFEGAVEGDGWSCTPEGWASMNAFVAQITVAGVVDFKLYAIWALRNALEDIPAQVSNGGHITNLDREVPAAAVWILEAGKMMFTEWLGLKDFGHGNAAKGGMLWVGEGYEPERWVFWRERFRWVGEQRDVKTTEETRVWARRALEKMEEIERMEKPRKWVDPFAVDAQTVRGRP